MISKANPTTLRAVVLDWAGTAVDYGCMGPAAVFVEVFRKFNIAVTVSEARQFMGLAKKEHIRSMCALPSVVAQWQAKTGQVPDEADVERLYSETEPMMVAAISKHAEPIPGLFDFVDGMRERGIKIGTCTGYTAPMMEALVPAAAKQGYRPDAIVCASDVPKGRPSPFMCYLNALKLGIYPFAAMAKIGDTLSDIEEGINAGMWTIGLTQSGNELGLAEKEISRMPRNELDTRLLEIESRYRQTGAHYVVKGIWECLSVIDRINERLAAGERP